MADQVEVDLIIRALAEGFDKLGNDIGGLGKAADTATPKVQKTGLSLTDLKSGIDLATQAAQIAGGVFQQAFNLAAEGAQLKDTTDSLTRLAEQSGYAGDLMEDLGKASGGTVDDLDYMGSTIRLLTGETGKFSTQLATAAPQLLTMARAAVKLNPTLGDTATAYEAITKAIETGQVRALKNYGIVVDATGTKEERLQQILEAMPGLMEQVGGNVETTSDSVNRFNQVIDDGKDKLQLFLADGLLPIIDGVFALTDAIEQNKEAAITHNMTFDEYVQSMGAAGPIIQLFNTLTGGATEASLAAAQAKAADAAEVERLMNATTDLSSITESWAENTFYANQALVEQNDSVYVAYTSSQLFADKLALVNEHAALMITTLQDAKPPVDEMLDSLNQDIQSPLESFIKDLQFLAASGGQDFKGAFQAVQEALADGKITPEQAADFTAEILASVMDVKVAMGELSFDEAAQSLADNLNIPLEEAVTLLNEVKTSTEIIAGMNTVISMDTQPAQDALAILENMETSVKNIDGTHNVHFNITQTGAVPTTGSGPDANKPGSATGLAGGADFIVPPGYPNDSFGPLYVQSGEHVQVTPAGEVGSGGGMQVIQVVLDGRVIAETMSPYLGSMARQAVANGAGRYG